MVCYLFKRVLAREILFFLFSFLFVKEGLSKKLLKWVSNCRIDSRMLSKCVYILTNVFNADDVMIFCKGNKSYLKITSELIEFYRLHWVNGTIEKKVTFMLLLRLLHF